MNKYIMLLGIISLALITACAQNQTVAELKPDPAPQVQEVIEAETPDPEPEEEDAPEEPELAPEEPAPQVKEFDVTAKQWDFTPSTITVTKGDTVKLNINSVDVTHGLSIFEFGVNQRISPGKKETVEFVADKKGEFTFFCSVPCGSGHRDMKGTLIVE